MEKIASFTVNHDKLQRGLYVSRIDGDAVTYDLRMMVPNAGDYLAVPAMHTLEHLLATYARSSAEKDAVIYVGPMGCRTGFYILLRDSVSRARAIGLVQEALAFAAAFEGPIPGAARQECGNYREHDLAGAKAEAGEMCRVLRDWTEDDLAYEN